MDNKILESIEKEQYKKRPSIKVGDTVKMHLKIKEGNKERVQVFQGVIIGIKGTGLSQTVTVRKISYGVGVEKIVPLYSTMLEKIEIIKRGTVRKSKLYFLRGRVGRRALKVSNVKDVYETDELEVPEEGKDESVSEEVESVDEKEVKE
ncbi:MAG TPA: 50S ribosomal protein L19 [Candidatus Dojkabacteria bacterium]|nr:50S ribosomal protein L19 [Candidatus Dojkabacteria bacterium]HNW23184.1 50S ribosomal protein L19 [Candidatus Dojkabacteria bacterium]